MAGTGSRILSWLFMINLGIALGAGLYEVRIVMSEWGAPRRLNSM
jgi:hypothetical protein